MKNYSLTIQALLVLFVAFLKEGTGVEFTASEFETTITVLVGIVAAVGVWYGRIRKKDVNFIGKRNAE